MRIDLHNIDIGGLQGYNPQVGQLWNITHHIPHGMIRFFNLHIKYIFGSLRSLPFPCLFLSLCYPSKPLDTYLYIYPQIHIGFYEVAFAYSIWVGVQENKKNEKKSNFLKNSLNKKLFITWDHFRLYVRTMFRCTIICLFVFLNMTLKIISIFRYVHYLW